MLVKLTVRASITSLKAGVSQGRAADRVDLERLPTVFVHPPARTVRNIAIWRQSSLIVVTATNLHQTEWVTRPPAQVFLELRSSKQNPWTVIQMESGGVPCLVQLSWLVVWSVRSEEPDEREYKERFQSDSISSCWPDRDKPTATCLTPESN